MSAQHQDVRKVTVQTLKQMKAAGERIVSLTAYDAAFARVLDAAGCDFILVGDSVGMVVQGHATTIPVTIDDIIYHTRMVVRGTQRSLVMADMPFMSYSSAQDCLLNAARLMKEGGAEMVKLEWGELQLDMVYRLTECGIPVCAHLGLTPQTVHALGGYRVQGKTEQAAQTLRRHAHELQDAGATMLVLEMVPALLSAELTQELQHCHTIGIGAGNGTAGQVLVLHDMLGLNLGKMAKFVHNFMQEAGSIKGAMQAYVQAVKAGSFPDNQLHAW